MFEILRKYFGGEPSNVVNHDTATFIRPSRNVRKLLTIHDFIRLIKKCRNVRFNGLLLILAFLDAASSAATTTTTTTATTTAGLISLLEGSRRGDVPSAR